MTPLLESGFLPSKFNLLRKSAKMSTRRFLHPVKGGLLLAMTAISGLLVLSGCTGESPKVEKPAAISPVAKGAHGDDHDGDQGHHHHHADKGPHGGALVAIGEDDAHLEIVLDVETGKLTAYALDGEAEKPISIKQLNLQLALTLEPAGGGEDKKDDLPDSMLILMLEAVSPADGLATQFSGQKDELKGVERFEAALTSITVGDKQFKGVNFKYPEGNEHDHDH